MLESIITQISTIIKNLYASNKFIALFFFILVMVVGFPISILPFVFWYLDK